MLRPVRDIIPHVLDDVDLLTGTYPPETKRVFEPMHDYDDSEDEHSADDEHEGEYMSEEKVGDEKAQSFDWEHNAMRGHSLLDIQAAMSKALSELTGEKLTVSVMNLDFVPAWAGLNASTAGSTQCVLRIRPARDDDDSPF